MTKKLRSNKKRNSALLYEALIRHISKCIIEDNKKEATKALEISKKYFSEGTPLRNELKLFQSVLSSKSVSRDAMAKIVEYACKSASYMNPRVLDEHKSKLIKEINYNLTDKVYDYKIPDYINVSSLQMLFNESRNQNKKLDEVLKIKIKDMLITRLVEYKEKANADFRVKPQYSNTVYKLLVNKFHEKYASSLTENQKRFLIQYAASMMSEDQKTFKEFVGKENSRILSSLKNVKDKKISEDKELSKKLNECAEKYKKDLVFESFSDEKNILEFLQYIKLADEINS